ncbi:MAG: hypothetical protein JSR98_12345 [Proteobacteria bacterium]|nr:hypothetical protein [Pseudomonadota bacterium]
MSGDSGIGLLLMAVGAILAGLCGQCTLSTRMYWPMSLVIGGVPTLIGIAVFVMGFRMWWEAREGDR